MSKMAAPSFPALRPSHAVRYLIVIVILLFLLLTFGGGTRGGYHLIPAPMTAPGEVRDSQQEPISSVQLPSPSSDQLVAHPIDKLIHDANLAFAETMSKEVETVQQAAQAYRRRRGRHPPPGFDRWFEFAKKNRAVIVEDFFDQIYHDLEPFWGLGPASMRKEASEFEMTITIRNGLASTTSDWFWTEIWLDLIKSIAAFLPDMDLPLNAMDEPRIVVPFEDMKSYMKRAAKNRALVPADTVVSRYRSLPPGKLEPGARLQEKNWKNWTPFWPFARRGCHRRSLARTAKLQTSFAEPPNIHDAYDAAHMHEGYVSNYTSATDICHQPDLQGTEGIFIRPLSLQVTDKLFPLFGGSKLSINNEILLPAPMYWNEEERFTGGQYHGGPWAEKRSKAIWRGIATGGNNTADNWRGFQRHRFVSLSNGTKVAAVADGTAIAENFGMPSGRYGLSASKDNLLGQWLDEWADAGFIDLFCEDEAQHPKCHYTDFYFRLVEGMSMADQFDHKFLPDIDGNSFSGRYLGFLRSTSLPIKATLWREWHDSRLVPWKHFVPMDNRFGDYYGIMEYFLGYKGRNSHDKAAEKIATEGKEWVEKVLRKEDMQIYVFRLLLEYARVSSDERQVMGWVDDVLADPSVGETWASWR